MSNETEAEKHEPVAYVTGYYAGYPTIAPLNPEMVMTTGMALYTHPPKPDWVELTKTAWQDGYDTAKREVEKQEPVIDKTAAIRIATALGWEPKQTLRDYFAAKAMQAILHHYDSAFDDETADEDDVPFPELLAKDAYIMADAMLKVRNT